MRFAFRRDVALGTYSPGQSLLHALDPRTKLIAFVALAVVLFRASASVVVPLVAMIVIGLLAAGIPGRRLVGAVRALAWILLITIGFQALWLGPRIHGGMAEGAAVGVLMALRLLGMVGLTLALTATTEPIRLTDGLRWLFGWLGPLRVPVADLALVLTLALRFLPTVLEEAERVVTAQRARGATFGGGPLRRAQSLIPLAVPLFAGCLRRADVLAMAMEARGFTRGPRTQMDPLRLRAVDLWTLVALSAILAGVWAAGRLG